MNLDEEIEKIVRSHGAEFYDSETVSENDRTIYRIYITRPGGVDLDLCAEISNDLSPMLDIHPPVSGNYFLEVSSPGIERRLSKPRHFRNAVGERVRLKTTDGKTLRGTVESADDEAVLIRDGDGEQRLEYPKILKARTYFDWDDRS